jgi:hypothetical protein
MCKSITVYLSGGFHTPWRKEIIEACKGLPIVFLDPLCKEVGPDGKWKNIHKLENEKEYEDKLINQSPYWYTDKLAVKNADITFVYFEDYGREEGKLRGTGDVFEAGMAFALDKLVICVNEVDHRYFRQLSRLFTTFDKLEEGIKYLKEKCTWLAC